MRMGPFISLVSETYCLPENSVAVVARVMREAGWLTTGARGVNAPEMTAVDAARLTLALLSGETPGKVVGEYEALRSLEASFTPPDSGFNSGSGLDQPHCLEDALIWLFGLNSSTPTIRRYGRESLGRWEWPTVSVTLDASARSSMLYLAGNSSIYEAPARLRQIEAWMEERAPKELSPEQQAQRAESRNATWDALHTDNRVMMRVVRTITQREISRIAEAIAGPASPPSARDTGSTHA